MMRLLFVSPILLLSLAGWAGDAPPAGTPRLTRQQIHEHDLREGEWGVRQMAGPRAQPEWPAARPPDCSDGVGAVA